MARTELRIPDELWEKIKINAKKNDRTTNSQIVSLIKRGMLVQDVYKLPDGRIVDSYEYTKDDTPNGSSLHEEAPIYDAEEETVRFPDLRTAAGPAIPAEVFPDDYVDVPVSELPKKVNTKTHAVLRIVGNSMVKVGIHRGDTVLIQHTREMAHDSIVVLWVEKREGVT